MTSHETTGPRRGAMSQAAGSSRLDTGVLAQFGALAAAIIASACCWLPLLLIVFGISGGALAATFEAWRPVFLPVTFLLLGMAFYFTYRKPKAAGTSAGGLDGSADASCALPGGASNSEACCPPEGSKTWTLKRVNKVMLWVVTVFVLAFAFFPNYVGYLLGGGDTLAGRADLEKVVVRIEGMTCEACAATLEKAIEKVPGVVDAEVSYEQGEAVIGVAEGTAVPRRAILQAIASAGDYRGTFADQVRWTLAIEGMTCEGCAARLRAELSKVPGVSQASASYERGQAVVEASPSVTKESLRAAVSHAGYVLKSATRRPADTG